MIIAIDGESASGKGTLGKLLAKRLNCTYLDTGLLYRAVAYLANQQNVLNNKAKLLQIAKSLTMQDLNHLELKGFEVAALASKVAMIAEVREILLAFQRDFANNSYKTMGLQGAILDGRDIGTVICPKADYKFFIIASIEVRANRRFKELQQDPINKYLTLEEVYESLRKRDLQDKTRVHSALTPATDAIIIDNTLLGINETLELVLTYISSKDKEILSNMAKNKEK
ncbi:Cytidylate kinase [Candidatus Hepatincola sp. Pdp]